METIKLSDQDDREAIIAQKAAEGKILLADAIKNEITGYTEPVIDTLPDGTKVITIPSEPIKDNIQYLTFGTVEEAPTPHPPTDREMIRDLQARVEILEGMVL